MLENTAVFFDVDDTLLDNYSAFKCTIRKYYPDSFLEEPFLKRLYHEFRCHSEKIYKFYQEGKLDKKKKDERWLLVMETLNSKKNTNLSELDAYYHLCQSKQTLSVEMSLLLSVLKKSGILCGIITNGFTQQQQSKLDQLELDRFIEPRWQFISEKLGDAKQSVSCFRKVSKQLPEKITKIYYLGDSYQNDVIPSRLAGWCPIWLNHFVDDEAAEILQAKTDNEAATLILSQLLRSK